MPADKFAEELVRRTEALESNKSTWNAAYQDVVDYVLPRRQSFTGPRSDGQTVTDKIFDSTAPWALDQLAAGLHSYLTSPTQRWAKLVLDPFMQETDLYEDEEVKRWLEMASNYLQMIFTSQKTNFAPQAHELYLDLGGFGTGIFYVEEDFAEAPMRFSTMHLGECSFEEDAYGVVNALHRRYKTTARNAAMFFKDKTPEHIKKIVEDKPNEMVEIIYVVRPRDDIFKEMSGTSKPFGAWYIDPKEKQIIKSGGFYEFPFMVPRWSKLTGETYGRGPAMLCMPDIKMVNTMSKTLIKAAQKIVDPPLMLPNEGFLLPIKMSPSGLNFYDSTLNPDHKIQPIQTGGNVQLGQEMLDARRQHIIRSFYLDWMQLQEGPQMTATEVVQRTEEKMRMMAPSVSRMQSEFLDPLVERVFGILSRKRILPAPPEALKGKKVNVEYVSPVIKAQRMTQIVGFQRLLESLAQIAQAKPEVFDRIDADGTVDMLVDGFDVSYQSLLPKDKAEELRAKREQAQQQAMQAQNANVQADTAVKFSKAAVQGKEVDNAA